jgi:quercetin 2,3-dioxygenase
MIIHPAETRGLANHGWLKSRHTFSFADYYHPERMGFGALRVINDDLVDPGMGFGTHPHRDMEIISIPLEGALQHRDSEGNVSIIRQGEVQIMSAGTGIAHSEFNASATEMVKFLQIWVKPKKMGIKPRYEQMAFSHDERKNKISMVVSPDGRNGSVTINQNAFFSLTDIQIGKEVTYDRQSAGNGVYLFVLSGEVEIEGKNFNARDGVGITEFNSLNISASKDSEVLLMEVPV